MLCMPDMTFLSCIPCMPYRQVRREVGRLVGGEVGRSGGGVRVAVYAVYASTCIVTNTQRHHNAACTNTYIEHEQ